jgi:hypothetical protein
LADTLILSLLFREKWLHGELIPNLQPKQVTVIASHHYRNIQTEEASSSASKKDEIIKWLRGHSILYSNEILKRSCMN